MCVDISNYTQKQGETSLLPLLSGDIGKMSPKAG